MYFYCRENGNTQGQTSETFCPSLCFQVVYGVLCATKTCKTLTGYRLRQNNIGVNSNLQHKKLHLSKCDELRITEHIQWPPSWASF